MKVKICANKSIEDAKNCIESGVDIIGVLVGREHASTDFIDKETAKYLKVMQNFGVPLDNLSSQGKTDWQMWASALKPGSDYEKTMIAKMHYFLCNSSSRAPFTDWFDCKTGRKFVFQNRTVQGGLFINMLARDDRFLN